MTDFREVLCHRADLVTVAPTSRACERRHGEKRHGDKNSLQCVRQSCLGFISHPTQNPPYRSLGHPCVKEDHRAYGSRGLEGWKTLRGLGGDAARRSSITATHSYVEVEREHAEALHSGVGWSLCAKGCADARRRRCRGVSSSTTDENKTRYFQSSLLFKQCKIWLRGF